MARQLTAKEEKFCLAVAQGKTQRDAYIFAYEPKTKNISSLDAMASRVVLKPEVQTRIYELRNRNADISAYTDFLNINNRYALIFERIEACKERGDDAAIARYIDIINKMNGNYVNINKNIDANEQDDIKALSTEQLYNILDKLDTAIQPIDNKTNNVLPQ